MTSDRQARRPCVISEYIRVVAVLPKPNNPRKAENLNDDIPSLNSKSDKKPQLKETAIFDKFIDYFSRRLSTCKAETMLANKAKPEKKNGKKEIKGTIEAPKRAKVSMIEKSELIPLQQTRK